MKRTVDALINSILFGVGPGPTLPLLSRDDTRSCSKSYPGRCSVFPLRAGVPHDPNSADHCGPIAGPPTQAGLLTALEAIRWRAVCAAAAGGGEDRVPTDGRYYRSENGRNSTGGVSQLSSSAALEAALEASEMSDEELRVLAEALATTATASYRRQRLVSTERRCRSAWNATARAIIRRRWPQPPPPSLQMREESFQKDITNLNEGYQELRRWDRLRLQIPCKHLLVTGGTGSDERPDGRRAQVTSLTYLPIAMVLASGYSDGKIRLWDPCDRRRKLAPPPQTINKAYHGIAHEDEGGDTGAGGNTAGGEVRQRWRRHLRVWPGTYVENAEEWTGTGHTFGCIASFDAGEAGTSMQEDENAHSRGSRSGSVNRGGFAKVRALNAIVLPGGGISSLLVCNPTDARAAQVLDEEEPWDPTSAGKARSVDCFVRRPAGFLRVAASSAVSVFCTY